MRKPHASLFVLCIAVIFLGIAGFSGQIHFSTSSRSEQQLQQISPLFTGTLLISPYSTKEKLIELLSEAKYKIRIRMYQLDDTEVLQLLKNKAYLGLSVELIVENKVYGDDQGGSYADLLKEIKGSSIEIITDEQLGTNFVHAKTFLIDDTTYIISTANVTYPSFFMNREYRFVGHDSGTIQTLIGAFDHDRNADTGDMALLDYLRICPFNCRRQTTALLDQAKQSIIIEAQYLEDKTIRQQLEDKVAQGVTVQLLRGKYQVKKELGRLNTQSRILADPNIHAKMILVDNQKLYIGSMNLSTNAIENNREIGIVVSDPYVLKRFTKQFAGDRETAHSF